MLLFIQINNYICLKYFLTPQFKRLKKMKNAILLILLSVTLLFSCKKEETITPDYSGKYSSSAILVGSGSSAYNIQYNALVTHSPNSNTSNISLYENYRNIQSNALIDTYTYLSPTLLLTDSKAVLSTSISAINKKGANVGRAVFDGTITYSTTDIIFRGTINGKSLTLVLAKLATTVVKVDDGW
jgi:hypothetical protein